MKRGLYRKLAFTGIRNNKKLYVPYILTGMGMVMMSYIISFLSSSPTFSTMRGGTTMQSFLEFGFGVMCVFSVIFLFYTNSFLIRRRKKEFGLYNILGMSKRNIARVLLWETFFIALMAIAGGLFFGLLLSKFAELGMVKILQETATFTFSVEFSSIQNTVLLFALIYALTYLRALWQVRLANPITLLHSENLGEKPPKANWLMAVLGAGILGVAYYMAATINDPPGSTGVVLLCCHHGHCGHLPTVYGGVSSVLPSASKEQTLLLQNQSLCVGFVHGIPHETQWGGAGFHLHFVYHGAGDAVVYRMPVCRGRR